MIEVLVDPGFEVFKLAEVNDEAVRVGFAAGEGDGNRPVVAVNERAMAIVQVLAVGERNVAVGFFAGEHLFKSGEVNCGSSRMFCRGKHPRRAMVRWLFIVASRWRAVLRRSGLLWRMWWGRQCRLGRRLLGARYKCRSGRNEFHRPCSRTMFSQRVG